MGEVIQIHIGQAGVQIANACWELYCMEHGIKADGTLCECPSDMTFTNFFDFKTGNKVVPRAVLVDSEPTVIDQIRTGPYCHLYSPYSLITGKEDSGSNFARGYFTIGAELIDITMESIRNVVESCSHLRGFLLFRSIGGGTGSGLGNLIAERLSDSYEKVARMEYVIFPAPSFSPLIVEPYNALLATHLGMDSVECSFILDNEALYDICSKRLNIHAPKYKNLNRIIGQATSNFTTSQRFSGSSNISFSEFQTNLVPYPRIHFPILSYAPFIPGTNTGFTRISTEQTTIACYEQSHQLLRCNPVEGKYMTSVLLYRGEVSDSDINTSILRLKSTNMVEFVDWSPTGFKVGTNLEPPFCVPGGGLGCTNKSLVVLSNNTIVRKAWCRLIQKYDRLFSRKAFIHHYISEGLEPAALDEASEDICTLINDYKEADTSGGGGGGGEGEGRGKLNSKSKSFLQMNSSYDKKSKASDYSSRIIPPRHLQVSSRNLDADPRSVDQQSRNFDDASGSTMQPKTTGYPLLSLGEPRSFSEMSRNSDQSEKQSQNLGEPSQSSGNPSQSMGQPSQSIGQPSRSLGKPSQSWGKPSQSIGQPSQSMGQPSKSLGKPSQSIGQPSQSMGQPSQSMGQPSKSLGKPSQSIGQPSQSMVQPSQSLGKPSQSIGQPSQSMGQPSQSLGKPSQSIGQPSQSMGQPSKSLGKPSQSIGQPSQSMGQPSQSLGKPSQSIGQPSQSMGQPSKSFGKQSQSIGQPSQSMGQPSQSLGKPSQSIGQPSQSMGQPSQSMGQPSKSFGKQSQSLGICGLFMGEPSKSIGQPYRIMGSAQLSVGEPTKSTGQQYPSMISLAQSVGEPSKSIVSPSHSVGKSSQEVEQPAQNLGEPSKSLEQNSRYLNENSQMPNILRSAPTLINQKSESQDDGNVEERTEKVDDSYPCTCKCHKKNDGDEENTDDIIAQLRVSITNKGQYFINTRRMSPSQNTDGTVDKNKGKCTYQIIECDCRCIDDAPCLCCDNADYNNDPEHSSSSESEQSPASIGSSTSSILTQVYVNNKDNNKSSNTEDKKGISLTELKINNYNELSEQTESEGSLKKCKSCENFFEDDQTADESKSSRAPITITPKTSRRSKSLENKPSDKSRFSGASSKADSKYMPTTTPSSHSFHGREKLSTKSQLRSPRSLYGPDNLPSRSNNNGIQKLRYFCCPQEDPNLLTPGSRKSSKKYHKKATSTCFCDREIECQFNVSNDQVPPQMLTLNTNNPCCCPPNHDNNTVYKN